VKLGQQPACEAVLVNSLHMKLFWTCGSLLGKVVPRERDHFSLAEVTFSFPRLGLLFLLINMIFLKKIY
jgi:hypothetical protein